MAKTDLRKLAKRAENEDLSDLGNKTSWGPPEGEEFTIVPELVRADDSGDRWGVMCRVQGGESDKRTFWANFNTVDPEVYDWADSKNAATFHYLSLFGLTVDVLVDDGATNDKLTAIAVASGPLKVTGHWRAGKGKHKGRKFGEHHFEALAGAGATKVVVPVDDDDDEDFFADDED